MTTDYGLTDIPRPADIQKDENDTIDILFRWAVELDGDTISTSDVLLPDGLTEVSDTASGTTRIVRVSGGSEGCTYRVTNRITVSDGRQLDKTVRVLIRES